MNYTEHKPAAQQNNSRSSSFTEKAVKTQQYRMYTERAFYFSIQIVCNTFSFSRVCIKLRSNCERKHVKWLQASAAK